MEVKTVKDSNNSINFIEWNRIYFNFLLKIKINELLERSLVGTLNKAISFWSQKLFQKFSDSFIIFWHKCKWPQCAW